MKRLISSILLSLVATGGFLLTTTRADDEANAKDKAPAAATISRDTNGNVVIKLSDETQKLLELKTETLAATNFTPELKAYGHVVDPTPLATLMTELATDQAAATASSNELARSKSLSGMGNASARVLEAAEATALHDQLQAQSARDRLQLSWGRTIAEQPDLPAFIQSLISQDIVLIRVDLPAGSQLLATPASARVVGLSGKTSDAQYLGAATSVDPQTQGQGFVLQIKPNPLRFMPGEAVTAYLKAPGDAVAGVMVPRDAILRTEGKGWVYVANGEGNFTRKEIALDQPTDAGWFVTNNIAAGDQIISAGGQSLLSEEQKSALAPPD